MAEQPPYQTLENLMAGPLVAAANANAAMAMAQTKFMLDTCFTKTCKEGHDVYSPVMITMSLTRGVITPGTPAIEKNAEHEAVEATPTTVEQVTTSFNLPMLTIIPLNSLAVSTVDVKMDLQPHYAQKVDGNATAEELITYSCTYEEGDNNAPFKLAVHADQLPLPKGVNTIIEAFTQSIQPITLPNDK